LASESTNPPAPPSGGNLKYAIIGIVLLLGAGALWFGLKGCEEDPGGPGVAQNDQPDAGVVVARDTDLGDEELIIPELEPDAGPIVDAGRTVRYVTRYVGGGGGGGGNWSCSGDIPVASVQAKLAEHRLQFRNCYERRLKVNNQLEGRVQVNMRVSRTGAVDAVNVGGNMRDAEVLACVRRVANSIRFAAPQGGACAVVSAPFTFTPQR
jgi:hypothetical protein